MTWDKPVTIEILREEFKHHCVDAANVATQNHCVEKWVYINIKGFSIKVDSTRSI